MKALGLYIHIPFCVKKCNYCDFLSFPGDEDIRERYVTALCHEIIQRGGSTIMDDSSKAVADSVFIGGGTPSLLQGKQIQRVMDAVRRSFHLTEDCEITIEANPGTITVEKLSDFLQAGINRLSMGVQSMDDDVLQMLGRIHRSGDFIENYQKARQMGFKNINTDLMFSLPNQNELCWMKTLDEILTMEPEHISFYSLIIEEGTPFYEAWKQGILVQMEDEIDRHMYWKTVERLAQSGYQQYEISNASKRGYASRHNLKYWSMEPYLGFGLGAHSYIEGKRMENQNDLSAYLESNSLTTVSIHENTRQEDMEEFLFTGLRKAKGIAKADFKSFFGQTLETVYGSVVEEMKQQGLLFEEAGFVFLSRKGVDISNYVMTQFMLN